jgi:hypothetical protein
VLKLGKYSTISVPAEVKEYLEKTKGNKTWGVNSSLKSTVNISGLKVRGLSKNSLGFSPKRT